MDGESFPSIYREKKKGGASVCKPSEPLGYEEPRQRVDCRCQQWPWILQASKGVFKETKTGFEHN